MPQKIKELQNQLEKIIKGKKILQIRSSWQCSQRAYPSGRCSGVGKTTTALALSRLMGMEFNRIQFTPDVVLPM